MSRTGRGKTTSPIGFWALQNQSSDNPSEPVILFQAATEDDAIDQYADWLRPSMMPDQTEEEYRALVRCDIDDGNIAIWPAQFPAMPTTAAEITGLLVSDAARSPRSDALFTLVVTGTQTYVHYLREEGYVVYGRVESDDVAVAVHNCFGTWLIDNPEAK